MKPAESDTLNRALSFVKGDHFPGIAAISVTPTPSASVSSCRFHVRSIDKVTPESLQLSSSSGVTINSPSSWTFTIPPRTTTLTPGRYNFQFETTDANNVVLTLFAGILEVLPDYAY
jgi:hypothetical protein